MQDCNNSNADAPELLQCCTEPEVSSAIDDFEYVFDEYMTLFKIANQISQNLMSVDNENNKCQHGFAA